MITVLFTANNNIMRSNSGLEFNRYILSCLSKNFSDIKSFSKTLNCDGFEIFRKESYSYYNSQSWSELKLEREEIIKDILN
jgi:hypothetical protein